MAIGLSSLGRDFLEDINAKVSGGLFKRLDGNAIMLNGFNRGAVIEKNEFVYVADNVLAGWGKTRTDGRNGDQPRDTLVQDNAIHELGFFESIQRMFQALTATTTLKNNIMYNMPRAAVNFNDGFGGGNVEGNLIWNMCRESEVRCMASKHWYAYAYRRVSYCRLLLLLPCARNVSAVDGIMVTLLTNSCLDY